MALSDPLSPHEVAKAKSRAMRPANFATIAVVASYFLQRWLNAPAEPNAIRYICDAATVGSLIALVVTLAICPPRAREIGKTRG